MSGHITNIIKKCNGMLYVLQTLKAHGLDEIGLHDTFMAMVVARMTYASCGWVSLANKEDIAHLDKVIHRAKKWLL